MEHASRAQILSGTLLFLSDFRRSMGAPAETRCDLPGVCELRAEHGKVGILGCPIASAYAAQHLAFVIGTHMAGDRAERAAQPTLHTVHALGTECTGQRVALSAQC